MKTYCPSSGKESFRTRDDALRALRNMKSKHKAAGSVYKCGVCGGFHVTHLSYREGHRRYRNTNKQ